MQEQGVRGCTVALYVCWPKKSREPVVVPVPFVVNKGDEQKHEPIEDLTSYAKELFARLESEAGSGKTR